MRKNKGKFSECTSVDEKWAIPGRLIEYFQQIKNQTMLLRNIFKNYRILLLSRLRRSGALKILCEVLSSQKQDKKECFKYQNMSIPTANSNQTYRGIFCLLFFHSYNTDSFNTHS